MATIRQALALNDQVSPVLSKIVKSMRSTMNVMEQMNTASGRGMNAGVFKAAQREIDAVEKSLQNLTGTTQELPPVQNKVTSGFKPWEKAIVVANSALGLLRSTVGKLGLINLDSAFARMDTMTNFNRTMTVMLGDASKTTVMLEELNQTVLGTAYGLDTAAHAAQDFVTRGMSADAAVNQVKAWADAVAFYGDGTNETLKEVTDAIGKMVTRGKVDMLQLDRLSYAGINAVGIYAQATGRAESEVSNSLSYGKISAADFISTVAKAMEEGTNGVLNISDAAKKAADTWAAAIENMKAAGTRGVIDLINGIDRGLQAAGLGTLKKDIIAIGPAVESALGRIGQFAGDAIGELKPLGDAFLLVFQAAGSGIDWFEQHWETIEPILGGILTFYAEAKGAIALYNLVVGISTGLNVLHAAMTGADTVAIDGQTVSTAAATKAMWGLNASMLANPAFLVVVAIMAVIAVIVLVAIALIKAWKTNIDFKVKVISLWNGILDFFGQVPIFFMAVGNGIADAFDTAENNVLKGVEGMANGVIGIINKVISALNSLSGSSIEALTPVAFASSERALARAREAARDANLAKAKSDAAAKAAKRQADLADKEKAWRTEFAAKEAEAQKQKDDAASKAEEAAKQHQEQKGQYDYKMDQLGGEGGGGGAAKAAKNPTGGRIDTVGKVESATLSAEDIKYLRDIADIDYINQYTTMRPVVTANFGDVHQTADVNGIMQTLENIVVNTWDASLARG